MSDSSAGHLTNERLLSPPSPTTMKVVERPLSIAAFRTGRPAGDFAATPTAAAVTDAPALPRHSVLIVGLLIDWDAKRVWEGIAGSRSTVMNGGASW